MATPYIFSLDHLVLTVANIAQSVAFYFDVLEVQALEFLVADDSKRLGLAFGLQKINLHWAGVSFAPTRRCPALALRTSAFSLQPRLCISSRIWPLYVLT